MYSGSLHRPSSHVAEWARQVDACWPKSQTDVADPAFSRYFGQPNTSLVKTNVAHATEDNQVVVSIVSISANLALCVFILPIPLVILKVDIAFGNFFSVLLLPVLFHVFEVLLFFRVQLKDKLEGIFGGNRHEGLFNLGELDGGQVRLQYTDDLVKRHVENRIQNQILLGTLFPV
jgi:hypothetical protein